MHYMFIPLFTAFTCWIVIRALYYFMFYPEQATKIMGVNIQGFMPAKMPQLQAEAASFAVQQVAGFDNLEQKLSDPGNMDKIMPMAEEQIDHFLRNKLKEVFPMIDMFIGDKTINQLKEVFMEELKTLFPGAIAMYVGRLKENNELEQKIREKINAAFTNNIIPALKERAKEKLQKIALIAALFGLLMGSAEVVILEYL